MTTVQCPSTQDAPTALVTGGSRGIGRAIARTLAREGFQVYLTYVSRPEEAEKTVEEIRSQGGQARAFGLDVSDGAAVADFFAAEIKDQVNLAVLVNNAGITRDVLLLRMKDEDFDRVLTVNLRGAFLCSREAAKIMSRARYGRIVNISSVVGQMGNVGQVNYDAAVLLRPEKDALRIDLVGVGFGDVLFEEKDGFAGLHDAVVLGGGDFAEMFDDDGVHAVCRIDAKDIEKI